MTEATFTYTINLKHKKNNFLSFSKFSDLITEKIQAKFGYCNVYVSQHPRLAIHVIFNTNHYLIIPNKFEVADYVSDITYNYVMTGT